ncbi:MAG: hypothetical protein EXQ52_03710 [Bryobacterales bacterium]|nr:hypothetical protein [Bryobacterales bacterium]
MSTSMIQQIRAAVAHLNPEEVRKAANRPVTIGLVADSGASLAGMEDFLLPCGMSREKRTEVQPLVYRPGDAGSPAEFDVELYEQGLACPETAFTFYANDPARTVRDVLDRRPEIAVPLARAFPPFRKPAVEDIIGKISRENAFFTVLTALPNVMPSVLALPWAFGEFASDTAFLTVNQMRMAFLIAAASDNPVGYSEQKAEIASIVGGAFGWRALARELAGKIPMGGGLIPKGAIAFAGTYVVGLGLERLHRIGYGLTRAERKEAYAAAVERGKGVATLVLEGIRMRRNARAA